VALIQQCAKKHYLEVGPHW